MQDKEKYSSDQQYSRARGGRKVKYLIAFSMVIEWRANAMHSNTPSPLILEKKVWDMSLYLWSVPAYRLRLFVNLVEDILGAVSKKDTHAWSCTTWLGGTCGEIDNTSSKITAIESYAISMIMLWPFPLNYDWLLVIGQRGKRRLTASFNKWHGLTAAVDGSRDWGGEWVSRMRMTALRSDSMTNRWSGQWNNQWNKYPMKGRNVSCPSTTVCI